jgi:hypothetical protein
MIFLKQLSYRNFFKKHIVYQFEKRARETRGRGVGKTCCRTQPKSLNSAKIHTKIMIKFHAKLVFDLMF